MPEQDKNVSAKTLGDFIGVTPGRISQMVTDGIIIRSGRGRYQFLASVKAYIDMLKGGGGARGADYNAERTRLTKAQADEKELQVKQLQGDLIPAEDVLEEWQKMLTSMRSKLLSIPSKTAHLVIAAEKYQEAERIIRERIYEALQEMSDDGLPANSKPKSKIKKNPKAAS